MPEKKENKEDKLRSSESHSSLTMFNECGYKYYLNYVKGLYAFDSSIWTHYGTLLHKYLQCVLIKEPVKVKASSPWLNVWFEPMEPEEAAKKFIRTWFRFCSFYGKQIAKNDPELKDPKSLYRNAVISIMNIRNVLQEEFGGYEVVSVEHSLKEDTGHPQKFSGLVDILIKKKSDGKYVVIDIKSAGSIFWFNKGRDKYKDYQLVLYKKYVCQALDIPLEDVSVCYFVVEKKKGKNDPYKIVHTTSGNKRVQNATDWVDKSLVSIINKKFIKNRNTCLKYGDKYPCPFYNTEHCKKNI